METPANSDRLSKKHNRYYDRHKEEILAKAKERYAKNKEVMKKRVLDRYYKLRAEKTVNESST
jgi:hypothetical protein